MVISTVMDVVGDGIVLVIVASVTRVDLGDGESTPRVAMIMWLLRMKVVANRTIGTIATCNEAEENFAPMVVVVDGVDVVVATTEMKADKVDGKRPVMVGVIVVVIEVVTVEDEQSFGVVHIEAVITKLIEVAEVATVEEGEVATSCVKLT